MYKLLTGCFIVILLWLAGCAALAPNQAASHTTLFIGKNHATGTQLWKTDGTRNGTRILTHLNKSTPASSEINDLVSLGNVAVFSAYHPKYGREIWRTDGTDAGTQLLVDTLPGPASGIESTTYNNFTEMPPLTPAGLFFWSKNADKLTLWKTDGTAAGTSQLRSYPYRNDNRERTMIPLQNRILFWADDGKRGLELWSSDGTRSGTKLLADASRELSTHASGYPAYTPTYLRTDKLLYFAVPDVRSRDINSRTDYYLWSTDGTPQNTRRLFKLADQAQSAPSLSKVWGDTLFYSFQPDLQHSQLLKINLKTGQKDLLHQFSHPNYVSAIPSQPLLAGDLLYFWLMTSETQSNIAEMWRTDGTSGGTFRLLRVHYGEYPNTAEPFEFAGQVFFFAVTAPNTPTHNAPTGNPRASLWRTDGTVKGTKPVSLPYHSDYYYGVSPYLKLNNKLLFTTTNEWSPAEPGSVWLHALDEAQPTKSIALGKFKNLTLFANPGEQLDQSRLLFISENTLWETNGTTAGTHKIRQLKNMQEPIGTDAGSTTIWPANGPARLNNGKQILTVYSQVNRDAELWVSDGTAKNIQRLRKINPASQSSELTNLIQTINGWYFVKDHKALWFSDGSTQGTVQVQGIDADEKPMPGHANSGFVLYQDRPYMLTYNDKAKTVSFWSIENSQATRIQSWPQPAAGYGFGKRLLGNNDALYVLDQTANIPWKLFSSDGAGVNKPALLQANGLSKNTNLIALTRLKNGFLYILETKPSNQQWNRPMTRSVWYFDDATGQSSLIQDAFDTTQSTRDWFYPFGDKAYSLRSINFGKSMELLEFDPKLKRFSTVSHFEANTHSTLADHSFQQTQDGFFFLLKDDITYSYQLWFMDVRAEKIKPRLVKSFSAGTDVQLAYTTGKNIYLNVADRDDMDYSGDSHTVWVSDGTSAGTHAVTEGVQIQTY